mmetsp:Transcript_58535/g.136785  ORF Transcript_58535/g.136785 Transcript_58535/m.136785 type:complete len:275 (-) Transcript_58535:32-856(-)
MALVTQTKLGLEYGSCSGASVHGPTVTQRYDTFTERLIWCHEHCHNIENRERRQVIRQSLSEIGSAVTFHKKALQFAKWVDEVPRHSGEKYMLVMGWREAQPCLRHLVQHRSNLPVMAVILCVSKKQFTRAATFVQSLPPYLRFVHVALEEDVPDGLLDGRIRRCFGSQGSCGSSADEGSTCSGSSSAELAGRMVRTNSGSTAASTPTPTLRGPPGLEAFAPAARSNRPLPYWATEDAFGGFPPQSMEMRMASMRCALDMEDSHLSRGQLCLHL